MLLSSSLKKLLLIRCPLNHGSVQYSKLSIIFKRGRINDSIAKGLYLSIYKIRL